MQGIRLQGVKKIAIGIVALAIAAIAFVALKMSNMMVYGVGLGIPAPAHACRSHVRSAS